ncbi:galactokinase [Bacillaceae bacterium Marseille-Q3522]|nr:galactokinase [Bacillaceae bacterium Marseille-Q3522]
MNTANLLEKFSQIFHTSAERIFFAPGRINLIGEHTDYNGGHVFPCAITYGTYAAAAKRNDNLISVYSLNFPEKGVIRFSLEEKNYHKGDDWANYPKGMIRFIKEAGYTVATGMDILFYGNIPNGAGLSSSASIELVTGVAVEGLFDLSINRLDLVKIGKKVENEFIGVNSGIMDQFAVGMGKADHGILLDCLTLAYQYAPIELSHHKIIIMNTNKRRELADSKYNERRRECEEGLKALQKVINISTLGDVTEAQWQKSHDAISSNIIRKRVKHAVYENQRTLKALASLQKGDLKTFGLLMNQSHISLRDDYEVTGIELDTIVEAAWKQKGVIGARMTGAGFGGCAIAIVETEAMDAFMENVGKTYKEKIGYDAAFYVAGIGDGAKEIAVMEEKK